MRNDLISKGKLLNKIAQECHYNTEEPLQSYAKLLAVINEMEVVVCCQDCANWDDGKAVYKNNTVWSKYCTANMMMTTPDFYCAWGERKAQEE